MNESVTITADMTGSIIGISRKNPDNGYIRVEQKIPKINDKGWLSYTYRSALLSGTIDDLKDANFKDGDEIPGKIVIKESLIPFNPDNGDRDLKIAGESGVVCTLDDQPIYRITKFTTDPKEQDELIQHNNGDTIREQLALIKEGKIEPYSRAHITKGTTL